MRYQEKPITAGILLFGDGMRGRRKRARSAPSAKMVQDWIAPDAVRIANTPLLCSMSALGDVVRVARDGDALCFAGVAGRGGHSTYLPRPAPLRHRKSRAPARPSAPSRPGWATSTS